MDERPAGDRRSPRRGGGSGRWTALRAALHRRLADDDRAAYWVRHVRLGVVLTEVAALAVVGYALLTPGAVPRTVVLLALAGAAILAAPLLLVLPVVTMVRAPRGSLLFHGWSLAATGLVAVGSRADGGTDSPLYTLLLITLGFMAVALGQPAGVLRPPAAAAAHLRGARGDRPR